VLFAAKVSLVPELFAARVSLVRVLFAARVSLVRVLFAAKVSLVPELFAARVSPVRVGTRPSVACRKQYAAERRHIFCLIFRAGHARYTCAWISTFVEEGDVSYSTRLENLPIRHRFACEAQWR
jgi:hypothetical protein